MPADDNSAGMWSKLEILDFLFTYRFPRCPGIMSGRTETGMEVNIFIVFDAIATASCLHGQAEFSHFNLNRAYLTMANHS